MSTVFAWPPPYSKSLVPPLNVNMVDQLLAAANEKQVSSWSRRPLFKWKCHWNFKSIIIHRRSNFHHRPNFKYAYIWEKSTAGWLLVVDLLWEKSTAGWWLISRTNRAVFSLICAFKYHVGINLFSHPSSIRGILWPQLIWHASKTQTST
jgi:hypothetical protein